MRRERSANSSIDRLSRRRWIEVSTRGTASEMNPGLLPVPWIDVPPRRQADSMRSRTDWLQSGRVLELAAGRHDVGAGLEQAADIVEIAGLRHVQDAVGPEGEDLVDRVRGPHPGGGARAAQLAGIATDLVRRVHVQTDQRHVRMLDDPAQRAGPDIAGGPLDHPVGTQ